MMIDPSHLVALLAHEPFQPFHIHMADSHSYEVTNPALVVAMEDMLFIALSKKRWKFLSYAMMTRIESGEFAS